MKAFSCEDHSGAVFVYVAPEKAQAKRVIWQKLKYFIQPINDSALEAGEPEIRINEAELTVTFPDNNAVIRLEGADEPDRLRGIHPHGIVLDEVGQMKRDLWSEVVLPSLARNNGWIIFIGTPKGDNLFKEMYDLAIEIKDPRWYAILKHVYQTDVFNQEQIEFTKKMMPPAKFQQEYMCDWGAIFTGAFYTDTLLDETMHIISDVPYNPMYPVTTAWDLASASDKSDCTVIWFAQQYDNKHHFIDYYEQKGRDIFFHINAVKRKPYFYDVHILPHDVTHHGWQSSLTREGILKQNGMRVERAKKIDPMEGISMVQAGLYTTRIDKVRCAKGINKLLSYRSKINPVTGQDTGEPLHDGFDACDALRTYFVGCKKLKDRTASDYFKDYFGSNQQEVISEYDYFEYRY